VRQFSRLSRIQFISTAGAFLAACSARGTSVLPPNKGAASGRNIASLGRVKSPLGHDGFQISSSNSGHAIAAHTSAGEFLYSFARGERFSRHTYANGRQLVIDSKSPRKKGWQHLARGGTFRFSKSKSGYVGICSVSHDRKTKVFVYNSGSAIVTRLPGKIILSTPILEVNSIAEHQARVSATVDNPGNWKMDDDFVGGEGAYPPGIGYVRKKQKRSTASARNAKMNYYCADLSTCDPFAGGSDPGPADTNYDTFDMSDPTDPGTSDPGSNDPTDPTAWDTPNDADVAATQACNDAKLEYAKAEAEKLHAQHDQLRECKGKRKRVNFNCFKAAADLFDAINKAAEAGDALRAACTQKKNG